MVGPTGSGKTELARSLSSLSNAPFIKVEATHFTEIGYHGKDVDTIIKDLAAKTLKSMQQRVSDMLGSMGEDMEDAVNLMLLDFMIGEDCTSMKIREEKLRNLKLGLYDDLYVNIELNHQLDNQRFTSVIEYLKYVTTEYKSLSKTFENKLEKQTVKVSEARETLLQFLFIKLPNRLDLKEAAILEVENEGIVFVDEIDKLAVGVVS